MERETKTFHNKDRLSQAKLALQKILEGILWVKKGKHIQGGRK